MRPLILGSIIFLLAVGSLLISLKCYPNIHDYGSQQSTQPHPAAATKVRTEEQNTLLCTPQSYATAPGYDLEKKSINV
jgi:hypothetical protein